MSEFSPLKSQKYLEGKRPYFMVPFCASQICSFPLQLPTYSFSSQMPLPPPHQNLGTLCHNITLAQMHMAMNNIIQCSENLFLVERSFSIYINGLSLSVPRSTQRTAQIYPSQVKTLNRIWYTTGNQGSLGSTSWICVHRNDISTNTARVCISCSFWFRNNSM